VDETGNSTQVRATAHLGPMCEMATTQGTIAGGMNPVPGPPTGTHLVFPSTPPDTTVGAPFNVVVNADRFNVSALFLTTDPLFTGTITLSLNPNPEGATLGGATSANAVNGVATFSNLTIDKPGSGFTLKAQYTTGGLEKSSNTFSVTGPPTATPTITP